MIQYHRYDIFHWLFLSAALVINLGYMLGIMTRPAVNRQDTLKLLYAETGWIKHDYKIIRCLLNRPGFKTISRQYMMGNYPEFIKPAWLWTIRRQYIFGLRHWNHALINDWIILSWIANMAGFLWLLVTGIIEFSKSL